MSRGENLDALRSWVAMCDTDDEQAELGYRAITERGVSLRDPKSARVAAAVIASVCEGAAIALAETKDAEVVCRAIGFYAAAIPGVLE